MPQHFLLAFDLKVYGDCHVLTGLMGFILWMVNLQLTCRGETDLGMNPVSKKEDAGLQDLTHLRRPQNCRNGL